MTENERDVELLHTDPKRLIVKYQTVVEIIVRKYIGSGLFAAADYDDIVQSVNEALLAALPAVRRNYSGIALLKTYISGIIRNICLKLYHKQRQQEKTVPLGDDVPSDPEDLTDRYLIECAVSRFRVVIDVFHAQRAKVLLCLKLYFRLPLVAQDIRSLYPQCTSGDLEFLLRSFGGEYGRMKEYEIHEIVTPIMNKYEGKSNSADALRKWTHSRIQEIIRILNGDPPRSSFDKETLQILFENYLFPFLDKQ